MQLYHKCRPPNVTLKADLTKASTDDLFHLQDLVLTQVEVFECNVGGSLP